MEWLEITVKCSPEHAEAVADVLARYAPGGVAIQQNALDLKGDEWQPDGPLEPVASVHAYLTVEPGLEDKRQQVEEALWHLRQIASIPEAQFRTVAEQEWANAWKEHFHVTRIGKRFVVKPSWREYIPQPDDIVIELDPGMAFGTGLHPTTQMCLLALEKHLRPGDRVLDLGTGSGILAIAAAKLGAAACLATDVDPVAVEAAQANVAMNGVRDVVQAEQGSLAQISNIKCQISKDAFEIWNTRFDILLVNILAKIIIELCGEGLGDVVRPGGLAVLAGLIDTQEIEVREALADVGLDVIERTREKDWVGLVCQKNRKRGPDPDLTLRRDLSAVSLDNLFDQRQPQANAAIAPGAAAIHLVKALKDAPQMLRGNADAGVDYLQVRALHALP
jgi:ribosomal protein L11 methyltransferase